MKKLMTSILLSLILALLGCNAEKKAEKSDMQDTQKLSIQKTATGIEIDDLNIFSIIEDTIPVKLPVTVFGHNCSYISGTYTTSMKDVDIYNTPNHIFTGSYILNKAASSTITTDYSGVLGNAARTLSFWVNSFDTNSGTLTLSYGGSGAAGQDNQFTVFLYCSAASGSFAFGVNNGREVLEYSGNEFKNGWHNFTIAYNGAGNNSEFYQDGFKLKNISIGANPIDINTADGAKFNFGHCKGQLGCVKVFDSYLNSNDVFLLYIRPGY